MTSWPTRELDSQMATLMKLSFSPKQPERPYFITISREYGCDGKSLGKQLAEQLNLHHTSDKLPWCVYDKQDLLKIADPEDLNEEMVSILDKYGHSEFMGYIQETFFGKKSQYEVIQNLAKVMRMLARRGHVILVGRGGSVLTQDLEFGVHLRLFAPFKWRAENHARRWDLSIEEARARVKDNEDKREAFMKTYLAKSISEPDLYHLMLNNERISTDKICKMVLSLM